MNTYLVGEVCREVAGIGVVKVTGRSNVTMAKEHHVRCGAGDEKVGPHVKFFAFEKKGVLDIPIKIQDFS